MIPTLAWAQRAQKAQEDPDPGARLHKEVLGQNSDGSYTLRLESYATGETEVEMTDVPSDIVLILDLSSSMAGHRTSTAVTTQTSLSYNDVVNNPEGKVYLYWYGAHSFAYQIFGLKRTIDGHDRYYLYWTNPSKGNLFLDANGHGGADNMGYSLGSDTDVTTVTNANLTSNTAIAYAIDDPDAPIVTFAEGNSDLFIGSSRLTELQYAVCEFIDQINSNDKFKTDADGNVIERNSRLTNRLAILTFAGSSFGNNNFKEVQPLAYLSDNVAENLKSSVNSFTLATGTHPDGAVQYSNSTIFSASSSSGRSRSVIYFTDGKSDDAYNTVLNHVNTLKSSKGVTVYSIGLFNSSDAGNATVQDYMNRFSSNYSGATTTTNGTHVSDDYYFDVSSEGNLSNVFISIASNITAESDNPAVEAHTRVSDGITSSFRVPNGFDASKVVVYTVDHDPEEEDGWYPIPTHSVPATTSFGNAHVHQLTVVTSGTDYLTDDSKVLVSITKKDGRDYVLVEGFDYVKDDTSIGAGDGNWVGRRYKNGEFFYAGKKLVIEFNIVATDSTTGGDNTQTNTSDSGLYIWNEETGGYDPLVRYEVPNADIPINLIIKKRGLRHGESATIQIYWAPQSTNYNDLGKLEPDLTTPWFGNNDGGWGNFSKVILTNKGDDGAEVVETLLCLDPKYVYKLEEDDWGWAYDLTNETLDTSQQVDNPFIFVNSEKSNTVKHAEAATINRFGTELYGKERKETVKSSKVESFTVPTE